MSQPSLRRHLTAGVLAAALLGTAPAYARGTAGRAWLRPQDAWTRGVSALWYRTPVPAQQGGGAGEQGKEGNGLDPDGATAPRPGSVLPECGACNDQGNGLDPDG